MLRGGCQSVLRSDLPRIHSPNVRVTPAIASRPCAKSAVARKISAIPIATATASPRGDSVASILIIPETIATRRRQLTSSNDDFTRTALGVRGH
mgnify:CR=1 FL=1